MKHANSRIGAVLLVLAMLVSLCGCDMDVSVATLPQGGTVTTTGNGDGWDGSGKLTVATTTTTEMKLIPTTAATTYGTTATVPHDSKYTNKYGIYHVLKGYCAGKVYTVNEWLPVLGYIKDGKIVDTMYTATTIMPSPNTVYWGGMNTKAEWDSWRQHSYKNIDTLNEAAVAVQTALGLKEHKVKVFLTLANPNNDHIVNDGYYDNWGSLDGVKMDVTNNEHRLTMIKYMVDSYIAEFNAKNYSNVELAGFYWFDESLDTDDWLWYMRMNYYIDSVNKLSLISPFYKATGWDKCKTYGFDLTSMQSNYFPNGTVGDLNCGTVNRLAANADIVKNGKIGGIEMEMDSSAKKDGITGWKLTMKTGVETGIVNGFHVHYLGGGPRSVYDISMSGDAYFRSAYDELYQYMHNSLTVDEIWLQPIENEQKWAEGAQDWL